MPTPKAQPIILSQRQKTLLQLLASQTTNSYRLVRRAKLILAAASGIKNTAISEQLQLHRRQVRQWRKRWLEASEQLASAETQQVSDKKLKKLIKDILSDAPRPGTTNFFQVEQVVQIVALACELEERRSLDPKKSQRPVSHWTPTELAQEAIDRRIVEKISPRSVGRFLKGG